MGLGEENTEGVDAGESELRELSVIVALVMESMDTVCVEEGGADTTEDSVGLALPPPPPTPPPAPDDGEGSVEEVGLLEPN